MQDHSEKSNRKEEKKKRWNARTTCQLSPTTDQHVRVRVEWFTSRRFSLYPLRGYQALVVSLRKRLINTWTASKPRELLYRFLQEENLYSIKRCVLVFILIEEISLTRQIFQEFSFIQINKALTSSVNLVTNSPVFHEIPFIPMGKKPFILVK